MHRSHISLCNHHRTHQSKELFPKSQNCRFLILIEDDVVPAPCFVPLIHSVMKKMDAENRIEYVKLYHLIHLRRIPYYFQVSTAAFPCILKRSKRTFSFDTSKQGRRKFKYFLEELLHNLGGTKQRNHQGNGSRNEVCCANNAVLHFCAPLSSRFFCFALQFLLLAIFVNIAGNVAKLAEIKFSYFYTKERFPYPSVNRTFCSMKH